MLEARQVTAMYLHTCTLPPGLPIVVDHLGFQDQPNRIDQQEINLFALSVSEDPKSFFFCRSSSLRYIHSSIPSFL